MSGNDREPTEELKYELSPKSVTFGNPGQLGIIDAIQDPNDEASDFRFEEAEEESFEDDENYSIDEDGTEWFQDDDGYWWYREDGQTDWQPYDED